MNPSGHEQVQPLIIIADDDDMLRNVVVKVLKNENYTIREAVNGQEALNLFKETTPNLLLLDVDMPVMDGFEVCAQLKSDPATADIPILMITAMEEDESIDRAFELGADEYIAKPINWTTLRHRIRTILEQQQKEKLLQRMQKMQAVEQLVGGIAHNFNNKLAIVMGYLELLEEHLKNNNKANAWVKECISSTQFCVELTKELLGFSDFQHSKLEVLNVNNVINSINQHITKIITPEIEVTFHLSETALFIFTSYIELTTALLNIITNACEAMPEGGKLSITTEKKYLDENYTRSHPGITVGDYIQITISDTGRGMDKELQKRIFDPFFTTKKVGEGTGLSLPIVYGYIKHNKGLIDISSEPGKGTIFNLYLPEADENSLEKDSA